MVTDVLEGVFNAVAENIEAHEGDEDGEAESSQNVRALEAEGVLDAASFPDLKVAHDVHDHADSGARGIEKEESGQRGHGETSSPAKLHVRGYEEVAEAPG